MSDANDDSPAEPPGRGVGARAGYRGDRARRLARPRYGNGSLGLRYRPVLRQQPINITALESRGCRLDDRGGKAEVTPLGGWGPWIDGGGWLLIDGMHVDLLYRDLDRATAAIDEAQAGKVDASLPARPSACFPADDLRGRGRVCARAAMIPPERLAPTQARTMPYPPALAAARPAIDGGASFALARAPETLIAVTSPTWPAVSSVASLCQTLFALNGCLSFEREGCRCGRRWLCLQAVGFR